MAKQDYYETLGVNRNASAAELKAAYRELAKKHHPDRNPGDDSAEHRFKEISEAYEVLRDDERRAAYDRFGHASAGTVFIERVGDQLFLVPGEGMYVLPAPEAAP